MLIFLVNNSILCLIKNVFHHVSSGFSYLSLKTDCLDYCKVFIRRGEAGKQKISLSKAVASEPNEGKKSHQSSDPSGKHVSFNAGVICLNSSCRGGFVITQGCQSHFSSRNTWSPISSQVGLTTKLIFNNLIFINSSLLV